MAPELAALAIHDLKNALGVLEAQLAAFRRQADPALAVAAHDQCVDMRLRCVGFLTLYGASGVVGDGSAMRAMCDDESPTAVLDSLLRVVRPRGAVAARLEDCGNVPQYWFFDFRLVRMALEAALHNAWRFARAEIVLGVREENGFLVFRIDDDGPGLGHASELGRLDGTATASAATGLGTALGEAVARAHASGGRCGRVTLGDRATGGARFELWLA